MNYDSQPVVTEADLDRPISFRPPPSYTCEDHGAYRPVLDSGHVFAGGLRLRGAAVPHAALACRMHLLRPLRHHDRVIAADRWFRAPLSSLRAGL
jgi:hypothetical protein